MLTAERTRELRALACDIRIETMRAIASIGSGHVGGSLSMAELLAVLYFEVMRIRPTEPQWPDRDWLVVSKGHSGPAVYSALALRGYFDKAMLYTLNQPGTSLPSHCDMRRTPGVDMTTGSLGQGFSAAMGIALANRADRRDSVVYTVVGDGEIEEGQVWEAALFAAHRGLDNLIAFVDDNGLQIDGTTDAVCALGDIAGKFREFGWHAQDVDGHNPAAICAAIEAAKDAAGRPSMIVLHTVKGKGVRAFENQVSGHSAAVGPAQLQEALAELEAAKREVLGR